MLLQRLRIASKSPPPKGFKILNDMGEKKQQANKHIRWHFEETQESSECNPSPNNSLVRKKHIYISRISISTKYQINRSHEEKHVVTTKLTPRDFTLKAAKQNTFTRLRYPTTCRKNRPVPPSSERLTFWQFLSDRKDLANYHKMVFLLIFFFTHLSEFDCQPMAISYL